MAQVAEAGMMLLMQEMVAQFAAPAEEEEGGEGVPPAERDYSKLEQMGFQVGVRVVERLTLDKPRFSDNLEAVKFICKDFWTAMFKKQIDNLKTNHKVGRSRTTRSAPPSVPSGSVVCDLHSRRRRRLTELSLRHWLCAPRGCTC